VVSPQRFNCRSAVSALMNRTSPFSAVNLTCDPNFPATVSQSVTFHVAASPAFASLMIALGLE